MTTITKEDIISAIRTEPLLQGAWIAGDMNSTCSVCVVGGLLRAGGVSPSKVNTVADNLTGSAMITMVRGEEEKGYYDSVMKDLLDSKLYLNALSLFFECMELKDSKVNWDYGETYGTPNDSERREIMDWVNKHIPDNYTLEI